MRSKSRALALVAAGTVLGASAGATLASLSARGLDGVHDTHAITIAAHEDAPRSIRVERLRSTPEPQPSASPVAHDDTMGVVMGQTFLADPIALDLDRQVRWVGPETWEIDREVVEHWLSTQETLSRGPIVLPHERDGHVVGVRVLGIRRGDALARLGLRNGDILLDVNGYEIATPDGALEAYARLRDAPALFVRLDRRGNERVHVYRIVP